ncbi:hypothetical protein SDC9_79085 [bioreactor metagenome]|uniref:Phospholipase D-like domain-containing protein n=1 Tax=bioreactor metagenome TaxID=1076179 RepID=A0A644YVM4_9ZZZZ
MMRDRRKASAVEYYERLQDSCRRNGWTACSRNTHAKLALFDTAAGKFVLEGSSNLNEAPNWEQFSLEQDEDLYDFYLAALDRMEQTGAGTEEAEEREEDQGEDDGEEDGLWAETRNRGIWS